MLWWKPLPSFPWPPVCNTKCLVEGPINISSRFINRFKEKKIKIASIFLFLSFCNETHEVSRGKLSLNNQCLSPQKIKLLYTRINFLVVNTYFVFLVLVVVFSVLFTDPVYDDDYIFKADILPKAV